MLEAHFGTYGETLETAIISDRWGVTRGFGFVTFRDEASLAAALAQGPTHSINGVSVEVKRSTHGEPESSTSRKVFVGGIGPSVAEETLKEYFSEFGIVSGVQVMHDYVTGRSRGFGFVTFEDDQGVKRCIMKDCHVLKGQAVDVKAALPRPMGNGANKGRKGYRGNGRGSHSELSSYGSQIIYYNYDSYGSYHVPDSQGSQGQDGMGGMGYSQGYGVYGQYPYPLMGNVSQYPVMGQYHPGIGMYAPPGVSNTSTASGQMAYDPTLGHTPFMIFPMGHTDASSSHSSRRSSQSPANESDAGDQPGDQPRC